MSRSGDSRSGGAVGHYASRLFHRQLHQGLEWHEFSVDLPKGAKWVRKIDTFRKLRRGFIAGMDETVVNKFMQEVERKNPRRIVFDNSLFGPLVESALRVNVELITQLHNCEYDYYAGEVALRGGLTADFLRSAYRSESKAVTQSSLLFVLSEYDASRLRQLYEPSAPIVVLNPMLHVMFENLVTAGVSTSKPCRIGSERRFLFLGSAWFQNRRACADLVSRWSKAWGQLQLVGDIGDWAKAHYGERQLANRGIVSVGYVEDLGAVLREADAMLCPMQLGSGIKVKVLDALTQGCRILASREAVHGFQFAQESGHVAPLDWSMLSAPLGLDDLPPLDPIRLAERWRAVCRGQRDEAANALRRLDNRS